MRVFKYIVFFCCLICVSQAFAISVHILDIRMEPQLRREVTRLAEISALDSIAVLLNDRGYLNHNINKSGDVVSINPGRVFRLGEIDLTIVRSDGKLEHALINDYQGTAATRAELDRIKSNILKTYQQEGYFFASLNSDRVGLDGDILSPVMRLVTGPIITIQRVRFKGLKKTRPDFAENMAGLRPGTPFTRDRLEASLRKIEMSGFLRNDSLPYITPNTSYDGVEVLYFVSEMKSNRLELGGGYLPAIGGQDGEFVGRIGFESRNLFGSGRYIDFLFDRKDRASSRLRFRFSQPLFVPDHLELHFDLTQIDYDSSYYSFSVSGGVNLVTSSGAEIGGSVTWTKTDPQRASQAPSRSLSGNLRYLRQTFDYIPNPSSGWLFAADVSYIRRTSRPDTLATDDINNESAFHINSDLYFPAIRPFIFRLHLETHVLITSRDLIDLSEQYKIGGYGSLRGYREEQFAGRRTALGQAEIRLRSSERFAAYLFGDVAYVYANKEILPGIIGSDELTRGGAGFGLFAGNPSAHVTMEVGWGKDDGPGDGKIHMALVTMF